MFNLFIPKTVTKPSEHEKEIKTESKIFENKTYVEREFDYLNRSLSKNKEVIRYEFNNQNLKNNEDKKLIYIDKYKGSFNELPQSGIINTNKYKISFTKEIRYKLINKINKDDNISVFDGTYNPLYFPIPEGYYRLDNDPSKARTPILDTIDENSGKTILFSIHEWHTYKKFKRITFDKTTGIWGTPTDYNALYRVYYKQRNGQPYSNNIYHDVFYQNVLDSQYLENLLHLVLLHLQVVLLGN